MTMSITTIRDTLRVFAQTLQISSSFPAALLVTMNLYFILPRFFAISLDAVTTFSMAVSSVLLVSYILFAFNFPLIRFLEGYKVRNSDWNQWLTSLQRKTYTKLERRILTLQTEAKFLRGRADVDFLDPEDLSNRANWTVTDDALFRRWQEVNYELNVLLYRLEHNFPASAEAVLASSLGNTIAAFEEYPRGRYGMESIALWPRLVPILRESKYHEFVTQEKAIFDFLLNMLVVTFILGLEFLYFHLYLNRLGWALVSLIVTSILIWLLYEGMVTAAREWGTTVRVAFDLHRHELFRRLQLRPVQSVEEEFNRWQQVSKFIIYRQAQYSRTGLLYVGEQTSPEMQKPTIFV